MAPAPRGRVRRDRPHPPAPSPMAMADRGRYRWGSGRAAAVRGSGGGLGPPPDQLLPLSPRTLTGGADQKRPRSGNPGVRGRAWPSPEPIAPPLPPSGRGGWGVRAVPARPAATSRHRLQPKPPPVRWRRERGSNGPGEGQALPRTSGLPRRGGFSMDAPGQVAMGEAAGGDGVLHAPGQSGPVVSGRATPSPRVSRSAARRRSCTAATVTSPRVRSSTARSWSVLRRRPPVIASGKSMVTSAA